MGVVKRLIPISNLTARSRSASAPRGAARRSEAKQSRASAGGE